MVRDYLFPTFDDIDAARETHKAFKGECEDLNEARLTIGLGHMLALWDDPTALRDRYHELIEGGKMNRDPLHLPISWHSSEAYSDGPIAASDEAEQPNERKFRRDVKNHQMTIIRDEGVNRHVRFRQPNTSNMYFDLITWPGTLCYHGDMGTYVFTRLEDMFEFFRDTQGGHLRINLGYWAQKLDAADRADGYEKFDPDLFAQKIKRYARESGASRAVQKEIAGEVEGWAERGEMVAYERASNFEMDGFHFTDLFEFNFRSYTYRFVWCCYALAWGIRQYDKAKA
jgi:hypothetical protein